MENSLQRNDLILFQLETFRMEADNNSINFVQKTTQVINMGTLVKHMAAYYCELGMQESWKVAQDKYALSKHTFQSHYKIQERCFSLPYE